MTQKILAGLLGVCCLLYIDDIVVFGNEDNFAMNLRAVNPDKNYWSMERLLALIVGNHEILKTRCRFGGDLNPETTLT